MSIKKINAKIKILQDVSYELSKEIIRIRVNNFNNIETNKELFKLECQSKKIAEEIKILKLTKKSIKQQQ